MEQQNQIKLDTKFADGFVDLSKPFDYSTIVYNVLNKNNQPPMTENSLYLTISNQWFTEIIEGRKDKEFREIKDTTASRYLDLQLIDNTISIRLDAPEDLELSIDLYNNGYFPFYPRPYAYLKLAVGYNKNRAWAIISVKAISFEPAMDDDGNIMRFTYDENISDDIYSPDGISTCWCVVYHLGEIVEYHPKGEAL